MQNVQPTIYGAYINTCQKLGIPITFLNYTTLNQKLSILADYDYPTNPDPILQYVVVGNGGADFVQGPNGIIEPTPIQHLATDSSLYNMIPFVLRAANNDLTASEMAQYRLRTTLTVNGVQYIAYYGLVISLANIDVGLYNVTNTNGQSVSTPFSPTNLNLSPTQSNLTSLSVNTVAGDYVNVSALAQLNITASQVSEFLNACNILYGSQYSALISEIGLCTGIDVSNTVTSNGSQLTYTEAVGVQINAFISALYAMYYSQNGLNITYNVGVTEPLMLLQSSSS